MKKLRILISGASVAGPTAAGLLARQGHTVTVVERAPALRTGGQTVDLRGAGRTVIERIGLSAATDARLLHQRGLAKVDGRGRRRAYAPVELFGGNGIVSTHEILRGDLAAVLNEAIPGDVERMWNDTVTAIEEHAGAHDSVEVRFARSAPRRFDLVIGADGMNSAVRRAAFGPDAAFLAPIGVRYAWFTARIDEDLDGWYLMHNAPGGRVVSVRPSRGDGTVKVGLAIRGSDPQPRLDRASQVRLFEQRFADLGWITPQLLGALCSADDWAYSDLAQVRMDHWSTGRVTLIGDAGYCPTPLTGLGTTLALVGAYVLASELGRTAVPEALARYEAVLRPFVARAQQLPPGGPAGFAPSSRIAVALSELTYRSMTVWPLSRLWSSQLTKADGIVLPDYGAPAAGSRSIGGTQLSSISVIQSTTAR